MVTDITEVMDDFRNVMNAYWYILRHAENGNSKLADFEYKEYEDYYKKIVKKYTELQ
jgi:hypothetical protein